MRLLDLDISGFKSFPDPVSLGFSGGITAIVGPNGCGKSNLSEAMTWVLGEQSAKSLRGGRMEDVIFNGSQQRKPLGMAEATLTLQADPSLTDTEDGRVTLARRVFRSGESQYRMNGKVVRLKQVKDFLMDTGLGFRAYSVIEQGKIGMILSGKPQERRRLLEEAAGITRYKQRKRIAEIKLEEATANLLRLDDIVSEVERSLRSLKRQAGAARRFQKKQRQYRQLLRWVLTARWGALDGRLRELGERLAAATARDAELTAGLHRDDAALTEGRETLEQLAARLAECHRRQSDLSATIEGRQELIKGSRRTLEEIRERTAQGRALAERREESLTRHRGSLAELAERRGTLVDDLEAASSEVTRDEENIAAAETRLQQTQAKVEGLRRELLERVAELNRLRQQRQKAEIELEKGTYRRGHLEQETAEHRHELEQAREAVETAAETVRTLESRLAEKTAAQERIATALETTVRREAEASDALRRAEDELSEARQRHRLLTELSQAHAERRARLVEALADAGVEAPELLAERLTAVSGWERALDFYLADLTEAVVLHPDDDSLGLAADLARGSSNALLLRPLSGTPESFPAIDDPAVVLSLGEALGLSEDLAPALPPAFLVDRPEDAERLARTHPGVSFLSREGLWAEGGTLHVEAREAAPGVLERERELTDLSEALPRLEEVVARARQLLQGLVEQRASLAKQKNQLEGELAQVRQELAVGRARLDDLSSRQKRLEDEGASLGSEREALEQELARAAEVRTRAAAELAGAEAAHTAVTEDLDRAQDEVESAKAERESLRTASADRRGRLELLRERLASHDREMDRLRGEIEEAARLSRVWSEEGERLERRRRELETGLEQAEIELQAALEGRVTAEDEVLAAQAALDEHRKELRALEQRVSELRERRDEERSGIEALRVDQAGLKQDASHLAATYREQFGEDLPGAAAYLPALAEESAVTPDSEAAALRAEEAEGETEETAEELADGGQDGAPPARLATRKPREEPEEPFEEPASLAAAEAELARLKAFLERLGPVNVLAVEEYAEQEERHAFLVEQRADVAESVDRLRTTIREINQTSSERFLTTFIEVNKNFGVTFQRLFRGGEAEMRLMDEDDVLESGIEILARPPGKRLQNIMLLSGGEKALTAVALLFALFRTKPSPFCILDEVDAPLDDVNTVRFAEMLKEMSAETQFIMITHNKITMEAAGTLYGVTMEEKGVSKLVSVEIDEVQPELEAKTA